MRTSVIMHYVSATCAVFMAFAWGWNVVEHNAVLATCDALAAAFNVWSANLNYHEARQYGWLR